MSISHNAIVYNFFMSIAERIKKLRVENGDTQQTVADYLNVKQNTYSQYETGQRQLPLEALKQLARFFDVSSDYILGLTDIETPYPRD